MGPFLGNGLFFTISVLTTIYFIYQKLARKKGLTVTLIMTTVTLKLMISVCHLFPFNWVCNRNKWAFLWKILLFMRDWGITTQRRGEILGNRSKKVGKHWQTDSLRMRVLLTWPHTITGGRAPDSGSGTTGHGGVPPLLQIVGHVEQRGANK